MYILVQAGSSKKNPKPLLCMGFGVFFAPKLHQVCTSKKMAETFAVQGLEGCGEPMNQHLREIKSGRTTHKTDVTYAHKGIQVL
jgi:hypothetical protein